MNASRSIRSTSVRRRPGRRTAGIRFAAISRHSDRLVTPRYCAARLTGTNREPGREASRGTMVHDATPPDSEDLVWQTLKNESEQERVTTDEFWACVDWDCASR